MAAAIQTKYAGCRFRSRLEARWAVFFDALRIPWEYEPQGYVVSGRYDDTPDVPYLPDFWLPSLDLWAEVKGVWTPADLQVLCYAALDGNGLPASPHAEHLTDANRNRPRILLLGNIRPDRRLNAWLLAHHKGDVMLSTFGFCAGDADYWSRASTIWYDISEWVVPPETVCGALNRAGDAQRPALGSMYLSVVDALAKARTARFEHGESGWQ